MKIRLEADQICEAIAYYVASNGFPRGELKKEVRLGVGRNEDGELYVFAEVETKE